MDRREFLGYAAAAPLVFGLENLLAQDVVGWVEAALLRMKRSRRSGVLLIVPDGKDERIRMGNALGRLLRDEDLDTLMTFSEAVFICAPRALAVAKLGSLRGDHDRVLISPDRSLLVSDSIGLAPLGCRDSFVASFRLLIRGQGNGRLRERAQDIEKTLSVEIRQALEDLDAGDYEVREAASATLLRHAEDILPWIVLQSLESRSYETRGRLRDMVRQYALGGQETEPGPRLPYGAYLPKLVSAGCGEQVPEEDVSQRTTFVACGMAAVPEPARKFIRFLAR